MAPFAPVPLARASGVGTGWGKNSEEKGQSVVRNLVKDLLDGGFGAPLQYFEPPHNRGRFGIKVGDLAIWLLAGGCQWA